MAYTSCAAITHCEFLRGNAWLRTRNSGLRNSGLRNFGTPSFPPFDGSDPESRAHLGILFFKLEPASSSRKLNHLARGVVSPKRQRVLAVLQAQLCVLLFRQCVSVEYPASAAPSKKNLSKIHRENSIDIRKARCARFYFRTALLVFREFEVQQTRCWSVLPTGAEYILTRNCAAKTSGEMANVALHQLFTSKVQTRTPAHQTPRDLRVLWRPPRG